MNNKRTVFTLLLLGLILRILLSFQNNSDDVNTFMLWGESAAEKGLTGFYERDFDPKKDIFLSANYPPVAVFLNLLAYKMKFWIYDLAWVLNTSIAFFPSKLIFILKSYSYYPLLIKLPAILSDIGIAVLTYLFLNKLKSKGKSYLPLIGMLLVLFNPAYVYNSAVWGQNDSTPLFFVMLSNYLLIFSTGYFLSSAIMIMAIISKQTVFIFLPVYFIYLYKKIGYKKLLIRGFWMALLFTLSFLPFYNGSDLVLYSFSTYINQMLLKPGLSYTSNHAFNFWYLLTGSRTIPAGSKVIANVTYEQIGILLFLLLVSICFFTLIRRKLAIRDLLYCLYLLPFTAFLFLTKMHERHLISVLPFMLVLFNGNKFILGAFVYLSVFNFLNMYHDWWSPNFGFLISALSYSPVTKLLTLILIGLFFYSLKKFVYVKKQKV